MKKKIPLKKLLNEKKFIRIVGAHNGMTAKLVENNGFEGVWASGLEISTAHAVPDANILTMTDFLNASAEMVDSISIPVISDCDVGYGNSNNIIRMVQKFEAAGISGVVVEDKKFPKVNSLVDDTRQDLAPIAEFVGKIMAAQNARQSKDFMFFARVEALIAGCGMEEALRRANAYLDAGADGIFIHSKAKDPREIIEFCQRREKRGYLLICPTKYPSLKESDMRKLGVHISIYANQGIRASIKAVNEVFAYMSQHGIGNVDAKIAPLSEVFELQGMHTIKQDEEKYLKTEMGGVKAIIAAAGSRVDESLKDLLQDRPLAMLDINGKSLLARDVEALNAVGINDINVIVGYKKENLMAENVRRIENPDYASKGILYSVSKGASNPGEKNIIAYSDIIFDPDIIERLLKKNDDIVLMVDSSYKKTHVRNKKLELVAVENPRVTGIRTVNTSRTKRVLKIGRNLDESEAHYEFVGLACLSRKGLGLLLREYEKAIKKCVRNKPKLKAMEQISFADFIQFLIEKGHPVHAFEVTGGWMEVHNFNDYKQACSIFT
jgi:phosphoenolpyruvate phosphomutase